MAEDTRTQHKQPLSLDCHSRCLSSSTCAFVFEALHCVEASPMPYLDWPTRLDAVVQFSPGTSALWNRKDRQDELQQRLSGFKMKWPSVRDPDLRYRPLVIAHRMKCDVNVLCYSV